MFIIVFFKAFNVLMKTVKITAFQYAIYLTSPRIVFRFTTIYRCVRIHIKFPFRIAHCPRCDICLSLFFLFFFNLGMERRQPQVEPQSVRRCEGPANTAAQDMETGYAHVQ